jgi:F-type H+-transporting ATPase subunit a
MENEFFFALGPVVINESVLTTWGIMLALAVFAWLSTRNLKMFPGLVQTIVESIVAAIDDAIAAVAPEHGRLIMPFIASLWLFLIIANLVGLIPGLHSPTRDLSVTSALAALVFFSVHWFGIRTLGFKKLSASLPEAEPDFAAFSYYQ